MNIFDELPDYDDDGNNIVPCPICMDVHCPSKEEGKCPKEDEFARDLDLKRLQEEGRDKIAYLLQGNYSCDRVWESWQVGTMRKENFAPLEESEEIIEDFMNLIQQERQKAYALGRTHENAKLKGEIQNMDKFCCPDAYSQPENDELILQSKLVSLLDKSNQEINQHERQN